MTNGDAEGKKMQTSMGRKERMMRAQQSAKARAALRPRARKAG
jgi:hypothetical protein